MEINENILDKLKYEVNKSYSLGEIPVGAVIFDQEGNIVGSGHNTRQFEHNVLGHAEINSILDAEKNVKDWRLNGYYMVVSLKPCNMCSLIIDESRLDKVFYFLDQNNLENNKQNNYIKLDSNRYLNEYSFFKDLLTSFFNNMR